MLLLTALETKGLVRRLAEPDLIALSGDTASFLAGGEYPVPTCQAGAPVGVPVITIQYQPFGVQLAFTPTVLENGIINLRLAPSVSELNFAQAVTINGFNIPSLNKREARTTVELRDGQSFSIAGLLQTDNRRNISQLPWIGSVPVLGALFSSKPFVAQETDLVVIVTPHLVAPAVPGQRLASPLDNAIPSNDVDFFLMGQMEQRKAFRDYITSGGNIQGPYGHIIGQQVVGPPGSGGGLGEELKNMRSTIMRTTHIIAFVVLVGGSFAGSGALAWDQDPFAMYFQRSDKITLGAGDAKAVNAATHVIDPWPRYVGNRRIPGNGDRLSRAVERYRQGSYRQPAPPISPYGAYGGGAALGAGGPLGGARPAPAAAAVPAAPAQHNEAKPICGRFSILRC